MSSGTDTAPESVPAATKSKSAKRGVPIRLIAILAGLVLIVAMALSTKWLTPEEEDELIPKPFNAVTWAAENFPIIRDHVVENAVDLTELAPAVASNVQTAGQKYGVDSGGKYTVPVKITAEVESVDADFITLLTPEIEGFKVRVPVGVALNGTPLRDVTGQFSYGDFIDQTAYQSVANELKLYVQRNLIDNLNKADLPGQTVEVYGAWVTGGQPGFFVIQPVQLEVVS